jgi:hypothetical protein
VGRKRNKLWEIETIYYPANVHWLFIELAPTRGEAIAKIPEYLRATAKAHAVLGMSLLEVDDEWGRTAYKRVEVRADAAE